MIITIARQCGSGGLIVAEALAKHYGIPLYTRQMLEEMARKTGMGDEMENFFGECPVNTLLFAIKESDSMGHVTEATSQALHKLVGDADCIIVGRCGNFIFRDRKDLVSVFLKGDKGARVEFMKEYRQTSRREAEDYVETKDENRRTYHNYYTGETWGDAANYDICIDSNRLGFDAAANIIINYADAALSK